VKSPAELGSAIAEQLRKRRARPVTSHEEEKIAPRPKSMALNKPAKRKAPAKARRKVKAKVKVARRAVKKKPAKKARKAK